MDKYYTPEESDLYVGYQCQWSDCTYPSWSDITLERNWKNTNEDNDIYDYWDIGNVRTKYLTKEDIESLGWKCVWTEGNGTTFQKDDWILDWMPQYNNNIQITKGKAPYFRGKAKSINELKKILEWIL